MERAKKVAAKNDNRRYDINSVLNVIIAQFVYVIKDWKMRFDCFSHSCELKL